MQYPVGWLGLILLTLMCSQPALALDKVTATVDKNPAMADESITLTVVANDAMQRDDFDPSVLSQDFKVIRTSVSSQQSIINLQRSVTTTWTTILFPRRTGRLRIPAIAINGISADPIDVLVVPVSQQAQQETRDIFISTEVTPESGYVQQQLTYTVKLHLAVELERGSLQVPDVANITMSQMGEDQESTTIQNGKRYRVVTRQYALIPQVSGPLTIPSPVFEGNIRTRNRGSFGGLFNPSKPVNQIGPELTVDILPIPDDYKDAWLPSEFVQINETWSTSLDNFVVGEPITRTITLSAMGVDEALLPKLQGDLPPSIKAYPDQPQIASANREGITVAQRVENVALVPSRAGNFVLPAISVPWFNTLTKQTEYATIPAQSVVVTAGNSAATTAPIQTTAPVAIPTPATIAQPTLHASSEPVVWWQQAWIYQISTGLFLGLWLWTWLRFSKTQTKTPAQTAHPKEKIAFKALMDALKKQDFSQVESALEDWLAHWYPQQAKIIHYTKFVDDPEFSTWVAQFYENRYGSHSVTRAVPTYLSVWLIKHRQQLLQKENKGLSPLYPTT